MNWGQAGKRNWVGIRVTGRLIDKNKKVGNRHKSCCFRCGHLAIADCCSVML